MKYKNITQSSIKKLKAPDNKIYHIITQEDKINIFLTLIKGAEDFI